MQLRIDPKGTILTLYQEELDLGELGPTDIQRASHVEPEGALWFVDLAPINGPRIDGFSTRSEAIQAENDWIDSHVL